MVNDTGYGGLCGLQRWCGFGRTGLVEYLIEDFVAFDHAQFAAGAFFDGFRALFEVAHFGIQYGVTGLGLLIGLLLDFDLPMQIPYLQPAALAQPQRVLEQQQDDQKNDGDGTHISL